MDSTERNTIRRLLPYLGPYPVIFDVGSNKGEWAEIVIDMAHELHLFEPNELLLHYTQVKFCEAKNVVYCSDAAWHEAGTHRFHYFTNENNGLSSLYHNHKWDYLPMQETDVRTVTLDRYCGSHNIGTVDIIKIDVEGAEYDVLQGCKQLLKDRRVRFIQIEYSEHYKLGGHSLAKVNEFVQQYGYKLLNSDLQETWTENYELSNYIIAMGEFTENWNKAFVDLTAGMKIDFALEIGCFEGLTTCYICDHLLNPGGRIICVDPLADEYLVEELDEEATKINESLPNFKGQHERFIRNTKGRPVEFIRKTSAAAFPELIDFRFDLIYVDGDHREKYVYWDCKNGFELLKDNGLMILDDFEWSEGTKNGINRFLSENADRLTHTNHGNQIMVRKVV